MVLFAFKVRWYSRRLGLATVYKMTELYFIQDRSEDYKNTWKFLHQRIEEAVQLQRILHEAGITPKIALETISSTFDSVSNISLFVTISYFRIRFSFL